MSDEWVVVGSGPSADVYRHLCDGRKVACVNGSFGPCDPDMYGIFETAAYPVYGKRYEELHAKGVPCYTRTNVVYTHNAPGRPLPLELGYDASSDAMEGVPFNSAGVSMLNAVANFKQPPVIHMIGFDGYGDGVRDRAMSKHIAKITHLYVKTRFVMHGPSQLPDQHTWRVERGNVSA